MVVAESYEDTIKIKEENEKIKCENVKLKKELQEQAKHNTIVVETLDHDKDLAYENKKLKEENQFNCCMTSKKKMSLSSWKSLRARMIPSSKGQPKRTRS